MANTPTSSGPGSASSRTVHPNLSVSPPQYRQTDTDTAAPRRRQPADAQVVHEQRRPRLHEGRPVRRDIESDEDAPPARAFAPSSRPSGTTQVGDKSSTTFIESSQQILPSSQPSVRDVARSSLSTATPISQEYIGAHPPHRPTHDALLRKDLHALQTLLQHDKAGVDARDENGRTALHLAAGSGQVEFVKALLEAGADVKLRSRDRATPLMVAATNGHAAIVAMLMVHGGEPRTVDNTGAEPVEVAARLGHLPVIEALIRHAFAFKRQDMDQAHPLTESLCLAALHGHEAIVKTLLEEGIPASAPDCANRNALMYAVQSGHLNVIKTLLQQTSLACRDIDAPALVGLAIESGSPQTLDLLLKHGNRAARKTSRRKTEEAQSPARRSALSPPPRKNRGCARPPINLSTTALHQAATQGKPALVEIALHWGGSLTDTDATRSTALMAALARAGFDIATISTIDLLIAEAGRRAQQEKAGKKLERDPAVYNPETLVGRLVTRLSQSDLVIQPRFWLGITKWLCTERRLRYSVVIPLVEALKQMHEAWPELYGGLAREKPALTNAQKTALCGHVMATLQGLHTLINDHGALRMFAGVPPAAPCYTLGPKTAKSLLKGAKAQAQGLVDLGAATIGRFNLNRIASGLTDLSRDRSVMVIHLCEVTGLHHVLAEAVADAWLDTAAAGQADESAFRKALWAQVSKPEFMDRCWLQSDLLRGFLLEQMMYLLAYQRA
jgi:ankyrin repeat protein